MANPRYKYGKTPNFPEILHLLQPTELFLCILFIILHTVEYGFGIFFELIAGEIDC